VLLLGAVKPLCSAQPISGCASSAAGSARASQQEKDWVERAGYALVPLDLHFSVGGSGRQRAEVQQIVPQRTTAIRTPSGIFSP
jgi:hypothetical protein